jgi:hypothetical protein
MDQLLDLEHQFASRGCQTEISERTSQTLAGKEVVKHQHRNLIVQVPEERQFKKLIISDNQQLSEYEALKVYTFRFISGYNAIWSKELGVIECELENERAAEFFEMDRIYKMASFGSFRLDYDNGFHNEANSKRIEMPITQPGMRIEVHSRVFSIRIEGVKVDTHDEALSKLVKISNSVLFQFDMHTNISLRLVVEQRLFGLTPEDKKDITSDISFSTVKYEYDAEPMALYMYARSAAEMPLLQYLAYYQVLEFYFPVYSSGEARQKIKNFIKSPLFDPNKETDIAQIVNLIKTSAKGKAIGDERSQVKATVQAIVDPQTLLAFFDEYTERKNFFDQQKKTKGISKQKINFAASENDIRIEAALRIYEIRCRVVHSKDDENFELLLPYSKELTYMGDDLELIRFLAQKAIIAGSRPIVV